MDMKQKICSIVLAAAGIAVLTACQNGGSGAGDSHVIPYGGGSRAESSAATPESGAVSAANDVYNAASFALIDMRNANMDTARLNGDYTFRGSDCEGKKMLVSAASESDLLKCLQGGLQTYYDQVAELEDIALHFENGQCTATAVGKGGAFACYPKAEDKDSYGSLDEALKAGIANKK